MTRRHEEKGDETIALRAPGHIVAVLRQEAIVATAREQQKDPKAPTVTISELMRRMLEEKYFGDPNCKHLRLFANVSESAVIETLETVRTAIETVLQQTGMLKATGQKRRERATA